MLVIDASVAACWAFDDEDHVIASEALNRLQTEQARVPAIWRIEVCNVLVVNERRGRIVEQATNRFLRVLSRLPILIDSSAVEGDVLRAARLHSLSAYDAAYLELAAREGALLATLDDALARAAIAADVDVMEA